MPQDNVREQYDKLCLVYDSLFSALLNPGRKEVVRQINRLLPSHVLEVGVGTGLCLERYRRDHRVTGIDISQKMIEKARERLERFGLRNVRLLTMDAEHLDFADNSFDAVVALYVVSVTDNPQRLIAEMNRVCRPGGRIYIVNHFSERSSRMRKLEKWLLPLTVRLGWKSYFERSQIYLPSLRLLRVKRLNSFGYWQFLEFEGGY